MIEPLVERFKIPTTCEDFRIWLTGRAKGYEGGLAARIGERQLYDEAQNPTVIRYHYYISRNDTQGGIFFDIKFPPQEPLIVEATLFSNLRSNANGPPLLVLENDPKLIAAFRELAKAIREKYSIEMPGQPGKLKPSPIAASKDKAPGNPVSPETVKKYHHLAKTTSRSARDIQGKLGTYTDTYYKYCKKYTDEEPINMRERAKLIKENQWPSDGVTE